MKPVVCLVCGSRNWTDEKLIWHWLHKLPAGSTVVHGGMSGADTLAGEQARILGLEVREFPVDHILDGPWPNAGPRRNQRMLSLSKPNVAFAFTWALRGEGEPPSARPAITPGTGDMVVRLVAAGVRVTIIPPRTNGAPSSMHSEGP